MFPRLIPETTAVVLLSVVTVAIPVLLELHVCPDVPDVNWEVLPEQIVVIPEIAPGIADTDNV